MKTQSFITKDDIRRAAPVAFAEKPTRDVSSQYVFANTETVVDDLAKFGWLPTSASQRTGRKGVESKFSPHMIKFANPDIVVEGEDGLSWPEIILKNRHDGLGSFQFMAGMFRLVCSNGLVIATANFGSVKIAHKGYSFNELREIVGKRVESLPQVIGTMNQMKERELTGAEKHRLALDAVLLRSGIKPTSKDAEGFKPEAGLIKSILTPVRKQDNSNDLWSVFNTVQEKAVKGGFQLNGRRTKGITSFEKDLQLNQALFDRALTFIEPAEAELVEA